ncbi:RCC1 domain-containing protein 1 [Diabrotica virgifera virgifera]|uniref:RCC1 domain-containing protein 1 n=1 Tax=Diabrotica virgifera virgifera TaxID=50390 RepID=A0A6P7FVQ5_DIAVI|nr:RCC1 domain-containing protein 1 [Diabrotica virgifera virgifera]
MKIYSRGFNLFGEITEPILNNFTLVVEFEVIKKVCLNFSYSIFHTDKECFLYVHEGVIDLVKAFEGDVSMVGSSDDFYLFLKDTGELLLGDLNNLQESVQTHYEKHFPDKAIKDIVCGSKIIVIYGTDGTVCKVIDSVPEVLKFKCNNIVDVKCGKEHCLILDEIGNVYSFGVGSRGQLGHGKLTEEPEPVLIEALAGIKIKKIATGGWHSCAISEDGVLYAWGWNCNGQIGLGKTEEEDGYVAVMAQPHVVEFSDEDLNALYVACGARHTIVYTDDKQLYGCGWNKYHQLKTCEDKNIFKLTHLHNFEDDNVLDLQCGPWSSAAICE